MARVDRAPAERVRQRDHRFSWCESPVSLVSPSSTLLPSRLESSLDNQRAPPSSNNATPSRPHGVAASGPAAPQWRKNHSPQKRIPEAIPRRRRTAERPFLPSILCSSPEPPPDGRAPLVTLQLSPEAAILHASTSVVVLPRGTATPPQRCANGLPHGSAGRRGRGQSSTGLTGSLAASIAHFLPDQGGEGRQSKN